MGIRDMIYDRNMSPCMIKNIIQNVNNDIWTIINYQEQLLYSEFNTLMQLIKRSERRKNNKELS